MEHLISSLDISYKFIKNSENLGQVASLDLGYSYIDTDYIFHTEDDWEFYGSGFVEKSLDLLKFDDKIVNINVRHRFNHEASSQHPVLELQQTDNGTEYHLYQPAYHGIWHGFAWNPGLRRLKDYNLIKPFKQHTNEQGVGGVYHGLGFRSACLKDTYCKHIGEGRSTPRRNE